MLIVQLSGSLPPVAGCSAHRLFAASRHGGGFPFFRVVLRLSFSYI